GGGGTVGWGVDSEHGRLLDVLLCRPDHFHWLPTSPISQATLEKGLEFDPARARRQHDELVAAYESAGVRCHFLEPGPELPYQVFARDSSVMTPWGAVITRLRQPWRQGEDGPVTDFYEAEGIAIKEAVTAAALEGGDVMIVEPGRALIGFGGARTQEPAARALAASFEAEGWEARIERFPEQYVHIDVLVSVLAEGLAAVCAEVISPQLVDWLRGLGLELIEVSAEDAFTLGANAISLGARRVISAAGAKTLNEAMRFRGLEVLDPELDMFTLGGGGAHCLGQALRRERVG
ncbi:MAG: dimethylarginine dimethylaminohydrolase family protein, partial [Solirubrobacterales bacterium]